MPWLQNDNNFLEDHLNDPNFDLNLRSSVIDLRNENVVDISADFLPESADISASRTVGFEEDLAPETKSENPIAVRFDE